MSRILRHSEQRPPELSEGDQGLIDAVGAHVERHFGEPEVFHEIVSPYVHLDLYVVAPTDERPVFTVVTCGMAERPMPGGVYSELMLILPPSWPAMGDPAFESDEGFWPFRLLKTLGRLPHEYGTRLWLGDTVPNGDPPERYAPNTKLCGALIAPMVIADEGSHTIAYDGREIALHAVWPLHADEMRFKLEHGLDRLYDLLDEAELTEALLPDRPSVVKRRRFFRRS
jgi:hypothetical protein